MQRSDRTSVAKRPVVPRRERAISPRWSSAGVSLLEVLVTLVILLIGLLGLAGIMARASSAEMESYQRVQALILAQDMVDRLNANRSYASCYSNGSTGMTVGTGYTLTPTCTTGTSAAEQALAISDLLEWSSMLKGAAETAGGNNFGAMIDARGCIKQLTPASNQTYGISVAWQGLVSTSAPNDPCGKDLYGSPDSRRRVVTMTVRIGILG